MAGSKSGVDDDGTAKTGGDERLPTKRRAGEPALETSTSARLTLEEARRIRGCGWVGDLRELRSSRLERFSPKPGAE